LDAGVVLFYFNGRFIDMENVYAVNTGCYSDYRIVAVFSTVELAEKFQQDFPNDDYNDIEEYELNPRAADLIKNGYSMWSVYMLMNGDVEMVAKVDATSYETAYHYVKKRPGFRWDNETEKPDVLISNTWAKTRDQAIKIANEHRVQMIANGEWV
jgi:hypothetical protein